MEIQILLFVAFTVLVLPYAGTLFFMAWRRRNFVDPNSDAALWAVYRVGAQCNSLALMLSIPIWGFCGYQVFVNQTGFLHELAQILFGAIAFVPVLVLAGIRLARSSGPCRPRSSGPRRPRSGAPIADDLGFQRH